VKTWEWATGFAALGDRSSIDRIFIAGLDRRASLKRVCARWRCTGFFELLPPNWFQDYYGIIATNLDAKCCAALSQNLRRGSAATSRHPAGATPVAPCQVHIMTFQLSR
jgi:hypothetical protein